MADTVLENDAARLSLINDLGGENFVWRAGVNSKFRNKETTVRAFFQEPGEIYQGFGVVVSSDSPSIVVRESDVTGVAVGDKFMRNADTSSEKEYEVTEAPEKQEGIYTLPLKEIHSRG